MRRFLLALALIWLGAAGAASPQSYPSRPVTLIVPFPAGGITDIIARIVAEGMRAHLGQTVIVENVPGAGGTIGLTRLARATPDGYTVGIGQWTSQVGGSAMYNLPFDVHNDLQPISLVSEGPLWIIGRKDLPANNLTELVAWLKANPKATGATIGVGSAAHLCFLDFEQETGTKFVIVPYRGAAPAMQDLLGGQIDFFCPEAGQTLPQYRARSVKAFAVLTEKRWFAAPDVPTIAEAGAPGLLFPFWHGLWAPKGIPAEALAKLDAAVQAGLADPAIRKRFTDLGHEVAPVERQTPAGLAAYYKAETDRWWPIIKAANLKMQ
ncbi:MAG TPA: tripartite tricarboxylate transporter substrate-binding protein [Xanthobacteraceae bacterium]|nr:tripartite tricarboxylate transporter substrate-binding protein [Xanthobacteraceae bacterium]